MCCRPFVFLQILGALEKYLGLGSYKVCSVQRVTYCLKLYILSAPNCQEMFPLSNPIKNPAYCCSCLPPAEFVVPSHGAIVVVYMLHLHHWRHYLLMWLHQYQCGMGHCHQCWLGHHLWCHHPRRQVARHRHWSNQVCLWECRMLVLLLLFLLSLEFCLVGRTDTLEARYGQGHVSFLWFWLRLPVCRSAALFWYDHLVHARSAVPHNVLPW